MYYETRYTLMVISKIIFNVNPPPPFKLCSIKSFKVVFKVNGPCQKIDFFLKTRFSVSGSEECACFKQMPGAERASDNWIQMKK